MHSKGITTSQLESFPLTISFPSIKTNKTPAATALRQIAGQTYPSVTLGLELLEQRARSEFFP